MACGAPALGCGNRHREDPSATRGPDDLGAFGRPPGYGHERIPRSLDRFAYARYDGPSLPARHCWAKIGAGEGHQTSAHACSPLSTNPSLTRAKMVTVVFPYSPLYAIIRSAMWDDLWDHG